jgi:hypothetical protein
VRPRAAGLLLALGVLAPAAPAAADQPDSYTVYSEHADQTKNGREQLADDTAQDSNRGEHLEDHVSRDRSAEGTTEHEDLSTNGTRDAEGRWVDDGSNTSRVTDSKTGKDGTKTTHQEEVRTDADGSQDLITRDSVTDASGNEISRKENRWHKDGSKKPDRPKEPEEPTTTQPGEPQVPSRPRPRPEPPIGPLSGHLSLDQTNFLGTFRYSAEAHLAAGGKGDGEFPDYAQWTMTGAVTNGTTAFVKGDQTCSLVGGAQQAIPARARLRVNRATRTARLELGMLLWRYRCVKTGSTSGGGEVAVMLHFATRSGPMCTTLAEVPAANPRAPGGSFTMDCFGSAQPGIGTVSAHWSFGPGG